MLVSGTFFILFQVLPYLCPPAMKTTANGRVVEPLFALYSMVSSCFLNGCSISAIGFIKCAVRDGMSDAPMVIGCAVSVGVRYIGRKLHMEGGLHAATPASCARNL